ncbi:MAG: EAL domain-containing protein [Syntrophales bacterium]|nr:EAL domain-containing protein [Syntrophales bacterium]
MLSIKNRQYIFRISIWVIILGGLMLTAIGFAVVRTWELQKLKADFERAAEERHAALKREIDFDLDVLSSIKAFYLHAKVVTRSEFRDFTASLFLQHPGIQALEWIPRVPYSQREEYEKAARRDGFKDFQITEQSVSGKMIRAGRRDEYFPVYFMEPYKGNELALGYDLTSNPKRKEALDRSRNTGEIAATSRIRLVQANESKFGFLVFSPVYKKNMPADPRQTRHDNLRGFTLGVFRIHDIIQRSLTYLNPEGIDVYLYDNSAHGKERFLHFHPARAGQTTDSLRNERPVPDGSLKIVRTLKVADREWQILFVATPDYVARGKTWQPWGVLLAGLLLTGLLAGFLIVVARRAEELTNNNELLLQEIAGRRKTEEELRLSEERFRRIFDEGPFGMMLANPDYTIVMANKAFCGLLGYTEQELAGQSIADITCEEDREKGREFSGQLFAGSISVLHLEKRYVRKDGGIVWANITASAIHGKEGNVLYSLSLIEDLTDSKKAEEKIHLLHYYDSLTGLPNRTFHKELIKRSIEHAQRHKEIFAIIYIGLDNFQRINDTLGHNIADLLLKAVADRLANSLRKSDDVARSDEGEAVSAVSRCGGDEFIVLVHDLNQTQGAAIAARHLLEEISAPYDLNGREVFMTASIGIALYPDDGTDVDDLLKNAEKAMRHTKSEGKNNYQFYSGSMNSFVLELLTLESDLHKALERGELVLYYQPKVDAATRMVKGMEALIRWKHPDRGLIPPLQFIPLAEASGLIIPIGEFVIRTVCGQIKTWQEAGYKQVNIALNISGRQFDQPNLIEIVKEALQDTLISPQCLELEITESVIMRNPEKAIQILTELNALGIGISIDDFGTGYSSLSYLKRLPLDYLKIDQSFVKGLASDSRDQAIVRAIIAMAHSLNLKTIAEGVETKEQLSFLQEHGCDEIQGYLFSRPLPAEEIPGILRKPRL